MRVERVCVESESCVCVSVSDVCVFQSVSERPSD